MGSVDTKFKLKNGWNLTKFGEVKNSKTQAMINSLTGPLNNMKGVFEMVRKEELHQGL